MRRWTYSCGFLFYGKPLVNIHETYRHVLLLPIAIVTLRPEYTYSNNQFGFTFEFLRTHIDSYNESINDPINDPINELTEDENRILEIIKSGRKLTRDEIAQEIGKSKATVQRCIKSLIDRSFIKRVGSNKTGYWVGL